MFYRNFEKNPTTVNFPIDNLDLTEYFYEKEFFEEEANLEEVRNLRKEDLLRFAKKFQVADHETLNREDLIHEVRIQFQKQLLQKKLESSKSKPNSDESIKKSKKIIYNLIASIYHDSPATQEKHVKPSEINPLKQGKYRIQLRNQAVDNKNKTWFEIEGLEVKELMPQQNWQF